MTAAQTIHQCTVCLRYFEDGQVKTAGDLLRQFGTLANCLEQFICGRHDCATVCRAHQQADVERRQRRIARRSAKADGNTEARFVRSPYAADEEREFRDIAANEPPGVADPHPQLAHGDEQARFSAEGDGVTDCNKMLDLLLKNFDANDSSRVSRGRWISNQDLIYVHKIPNAHSRASQLRGSETLPKHPFIEHHRLDVDTKWLAGGWHYSICFLEHSERLKREREKSEKNQTKFA